MAKWLSRLPSVRKATSGSLICKASSLSNSYERSSVQKRNCTSNEESHLNVNKNIKVNVYRLLFKSTATDGCPILVYTVFTKINKPVRNMLLAPQKPVEPVLWIRIRIQEDKIDPQK